jgi:heparan-alpha-glucosaminide N-acetyltransferase
MPAEADRIGYPSGQTGASHVTATTTASEPSATVPSPGVPRPARVLSVDLLRGADVLLMLFVNEVAGVATAPAWLKHVSSDTDGMTITDVVFPAFLFIVGLAVPFAAGGRLRRGEALRRVVSHVLSRAAALVVMGVLMVNAEHGIAGPLPPAVWTLTAVAAIFLFWGAPEAGWGPLRQPWLRALGAVLLVVVALAYRSPGATGLVHLRPYWWGILGLIGWAYLAVALLYLVARDRPAALAGLTAVLYCVALADGAGGLRDHLPRPLLGPVLGTHAAIAMSGVLLGVLLRRHLDTRGPARRLVAEALALAACLGAAGLLLHGLAPLHAAFRISKNHATAPWGLLCAAITCTAWLALFLLADVLGWRRWPRALTATGENPLVAYLLAPALLAALALLAPLFGGRNPYEALAATAGVGLLRSAVFAWVAARLTGALRSAGLRIQL